MNRIVPPPAEPASAKALAVRPDAVPPAPAAVGGRSFTVRRDNRGHFQVEVRIDGRRMDFLVDTGANVIAIPEREAARLGIHPARRDDTAQMRTANGTIYAAPTRLNTVEVGGLMTPDA
jgi:aspartyl protease family protein